MVIWERSLVLLMVVGACLVGATAGGLTAVSCWFCCLLPLELFVGGAFAVPAAAVVIAALVSPDIVSKTDLDDWRLAFFNFDFLFVGCADASVCCLVEDVSCTTLPLLTFSLFTIAGVPRVSVVASLFGLPITSVGAAAASSGGWVNMVSMPSLDAPLVMASARKLRGSAAAEKWESMFHVMDCHHSTLSLDMNIMHHPS